MTEPQFINIMTLVAVFIFSPIIVGLIALGISLFFDRRDY